MEVEEEEEEEGQLMEIRLVPPTAELCKEAAVSIMTLLLGINLYISLSFPLFLLSHPPPTIIFLLFPLS